MELFYKILWEENPLYRMYVYWVSDGEKIRPAILKNVTPFNDLENHLREEFGEQEYYVMIRCKKLMGFDGPYFNRSAADFYAKKRYSIRNRMPQRRGVKTEKKTLQERNVESKTYALSEFDDIRIIFVGAKADY